MNTSQPTYMVYVEQNEDGVFVGSIPNIPGCYAQGNSIDEMMKNLQEVVDLCLRNSEESLGGTNTFIGLQTLQAYA